MKTLVTGATGLVGSTLVRELLDRSHDVRILRRTSSRLDLLGDCRDHVEHAIGDVTQPETVEDAASDIQIIFHVAAYLGFGGTRVRSSMHDVNVTGTANVVNAALAVGVDRLVHTSSIAALGRSASAEELSEDADWTDSKYNTDYAVSKHLAELQIHRGIAEGLDAVMVNPSLIFGVGRPGENTMQIVEKVRNRRLPASPSGGTNVVDVIDVARGHILALERGAIGERYILGSENLTWPEIIGTIATATGVEPPTRVLRPGLAIPVATAFEFVAKLIPGVQPTITRETVLQASRTYRYDTSKARGSLRATFRPFSETMARIATHLRES